MTQFRRGRRTLVLTALAVLGGLAAPAAGQNKSSSDSDRKGDWEFQASLKGAETGLWQLSFSPDGKTLAVASSADGAIAVVRLWDVSGARPKVRHNLIGPREVWARVAFTADGAALLAVSRDGTVRRWDAASGKEVGAFSVGKGADGEPAVEAAWATASGKLLAVATPQRFGGFSTPIPREVTFWDTETGKRQGALRLPDGQHPVTLSLDGKTVVTAFTRVDPTLKGPNMSEVHFWDVARGKPTGSLRSLDLHGAAYSPDGKSLLLQRLDAKAEKPDLAFWDLSAGKARVPRSAELHRSWALGYSADGRLLAAASADRLSIVVWDVGGEKPLGSAVKLDGEAQGAALSPEGKALATVDARDNVRLWTFKEP
jgi:WD40 repeat protein